MFVQVMGGSRGRPRGRTPPAPFQVNKALTCHLIGSSQQCCERPGLRLRFTGGVTKAQRADVPGSGSDDPQVASWTPHPGLGPGHSPSARGHPESAHRVSVLVQFSSANVFRSLVLLLRCIAQHPAPRQRLSICQPSDPFPSV